MKLSCLFLISGVVAVAGPAPPDPEEAAYPAIGRLVTALEMVRKRHPDVDRLAYDRLANHALEGMLASLDPRSSFIHPEMMKLIEEHKDLDPEIPGLGMTLGLRDDGPYIAAVLPYGAAALAGVVPGSALLEVDGRVTGKMEFVDLIQSLQRASGERTMLTLKSPVSPEPVEVAVVHRAVDHRSVVEVRDVAAGVGYVRLASFGKNAAREMEAALDELEDGGMKSLMLDLRQNLGRDLDETVKILGLFLPPGTAVITTRGRDGEIGEPMKTPGHQRRKRDYPMVVLLDRMSASASELTAGALQDLKRATIIGEVSCGEGSVQDIIPLEGGAALRLTVATWHTPSGSTPHRKGITPDVAIAIDDSSRGNFAKRCRIDTLPPDERKAVDEWEDPVMAAGIGALREN